MFISSEWAEARDASSITLLHTGIEIHNSLGADELYHETLGKICHKVRKDYNTPPGDFVIAMAVKSMNDSLGPNWPRSVTLNLRLPTTASATSSTEISHQYHPYSSYGRRSTRIREPGLSIPCKCRSPKTPAPMLIVLSATGHVRVRISRPPQVVYGTTHDCRSHGQTSPNPYRRLNRRKALQPRSGETRNHRTATRRSAFRCHSRSPTQFGSSSTHQPIPPYISAVSSLR